MSATPNIDNLSYKDLVEAIRVTNIATLATNVFSPQEKLLLAHAANLQALQLKYLENSLVKSFD